MDKQKMADALEALTDKHPAANITGIETKVVPDNQLNIEVITKNPYGTQRGVVSAAIQVNIDDTEDEASKWDEGDEEKVLDLIVNRIKTEVEAGE